MPRNVRGRAGALAGFWRRYRRNRLAVAGLAGVAILVVASAAAPLLTSADPNAQHLADRRTPPGVRYLLGSDEFGRDIFARVLYGGRVALAVGLGSVALGAVPGVMLGAVAGYAGGPVDQAVMRVMDVLLAFPYLLLAIAIVTALGPSLPNTVIAIGVWMIPSYARLIRGSVVGLREREFVEAARALGARELRVITQHILPNVLGIVLVYGSLNVGRAFLMEAALSFLGLGVQPPTPSWGQMIRTGSNYLFDAPYISTVPGVAIAVAVLAFNLVGEGLQEALDPRARVHQ